MSQQYIAQGNDDRFNVGSLHAYRPKSSCPLNIVQNRIPAPYHQKFAGAFWSMAWPKSINLSSVICSVKPIQLTQTTHSMEEGLMKRVVLLGTLFATISVLLYLQQNEHPSLSSEQREHSAPQSPSHDQPRPTHEKAAAISVDKSEPSAQSKAKPMADIPLPDDIESHIFVDENTLDASALHDWLQKQKFAQLQQNLLHHYEADALKNTEQYRDEILQIAEIQNGDITLENISCSKRLCAVSFQYADTEKWNSFGKKWLSEGTLNKGAAMAQTSDDSRMTSLRWLFATQSQVNQIIVEQR